jgi:hypothetical protein
VISLSVIGTEKKVAKKDAPADGEQGKLTITTTTTFRSNFMKSSRKKLKILHHFYARMSILDKNTGIIKINCILDESKFIWQHKSPGPP